MRTVAVMIEVEAMGSGTRMCLMIFIPFPLTVTRPGSNPCGRAGLIVAGAG
jgi:hypothetical protein